MATHLQCAAQLHAGSHGAAEDFVWGALESGFGFSRMRYMPRFRAKYLGSEKTLQTRPNVPLESSLSGAARQLVSRLH